MKKTCTVVVEECWGCPLFYQIETYCYRAVGCSKLNKEEPFVAGDRENNRITNLLKSWFNDYCTLDSIK